MWQLTDVNIEEIGLAIEADTTLFPAGWLIRLFTNAAAPSKNSVLADFTQLTNVEVPGYAAQAGGWAGTFVRKQDGSWEDLGAALLTFKASGPPPSPQQVFGWYATDAGNTTLLAAGLFTTPFTFTKTGDGFALEQVLNISQTDQSDYNVKLDMEQE